MFIWYWYWCLLYQNINYSLLNFFDLLYFVQFIMFTTFCLFKNYINLSYSLYIFKNSYNFIKIKLFNFNDFIIIAIYAFVICKLLIRYYLEKIYIKYPNSSNIFVIKNRLYIVNISLSKVFINILNDTTEWS